MITKTTAIPTGIIHFPTPRPVESRNNGKIVRCEFERNVRTKVDKTTKRYYSFVEPRELSTVCVRKSSHLPTDAV